MERIADAKKALGLDRRQVAEDMGWFVAGMAFVAVIALGVLPGASELNWPRYLVSLLNTAILGLLTIAVFYVAYTLLQFLVCLLLLERGNDLVRWIRKIFLVIYNLAILASGIALPLLSVEHGGQFLLGWLGEEAAQHLTSPVPYVALALPFLLVLPICALRLYRSRSTAAERDPAKRQAAYSSFLKRSDPASFVLLAEWYRIGRAIDRGVGGNAQISRLEERMKRLVTAEAHQTLLDHLGPDLDRLQRVGSDRVRKYAAHLSSFLSLRLRWVNVEGYPDAVRLPYESWLDAQEHGRPVPGELVTPHERFTFILLEPLIVNLTKTIEGELRAARMPG